LEEQARIQRRQRTGPRQDDEISTMNLAAAAATGVVHLKRDQIWQGKRQGAGGPELEPLSAQDRERVKEMAVSVWDDEDDQDAWWRIDAPGRAGGPKRFEDVNCDPYDDEYDDTYDLDVGATEHLTTDTDLVPPPRSVEEVEENDGEEEELGSDDEGKPEQHNGQSDSSFGKPGRGRNPRERAPTAVASTRARGTSVHFERIVRHASNLVGSQQLPSVKSRPQQHQGPNLLSDDRKDLRLSQKGPINSPDIGDEDNEAFRKGRVVRTQPTDVPPQPLPKDAEFFPTTPEPRQPWYAGPSNRPGQQPRRGSGGDRGRSRAGRGGGFSRSSAGAPDPAGNYETESSSNTKQQAAARRLTPPPKAPASTLARRGGITPYQVKLKERYGGHNQRTLADRKRQL
uniref:CASC3/barentsz eIF4AIII-binding protein n=1 Tax=Schistocephalus solidus TaxID=70667 RepID=A0A183TLL7_SCHSO